MFLGTVCCGYCFPMTWRRYVDDWFPIPPNGLVQDFLNHINAIYNNIQFTVETEKNMIFHF